MKFFLGALVALSAILGNQAVRAEHYLDPQNNYQPTVKGVEVPKSVIKEVRRKPRRDLPVLPQIVRGTEARVYGMTGLFGRAGRFSLGVDEAMRLAKVSHPSIAIYPRVHWRSWQVSNTAIANWKRDKLPIILIGHSLGADAISDVARDLKKAGVPVAAAFYIDPTPRVDCVPGNVQVAIDWRNTMRAQLGGSTIVGCPDFKGDLENLAIHVSHTHIDDLPVVHEEIVRRVGDVIQMLREIRAGAAAAQSK